MGRVLMVNDGAESSAVLLAALRQAYANLRTSERSKDSVIVVDSLSTFKENKKMLYQQPLMDRLILLRELDEYKSLWDPKKDFSRSMFLTDARSKRSSHKGRKKKVNRLRVKRRVKNRHRRNK